ncbi:hypothetical protein E4U53_000568 [Claviceps sorghi]|nr:hypothetical protein E4U53_000568 [Claviceps sorghi]
MSGHATSRSPTARRIANIRTGPFDRRFAALFDTLAQDVRATAAHDSFLINHLDEPRVVPPYRASHPLPTNEGPPHESDLKHNSARDGAQSHRALVPFVENTTASTDLCQHEECTAFSSVLPRLKQNRGKTHRYSYLQEQDGVWTRLASSFLDTSLYDVSFTRIMQCDWRCCREQDEHFTLTSWADKDAALKSRLVFDMDGNGISGRYYKLLASRSAPLRQTLFREWHDHRLVPWVHHIPVSPGMEEVAELTFFSRPRRRAGNGRDELQSRDNGGPRGRCARSPCPYTCTGCFWRWRDCRMWNGGPLVERVVRHEGE